MIFLAAMSRLLPHPWNFTPLGAMGLFGAAYFSRKHLAFVLPLAALWISDLFLNNLVYAKMYPDYYQGFTWFGNLWVYASFLLIVGVGMLFLQRVRPLRLLGASLSASVLFFLLTNFGVWMSSPIYPNTTAGLISAYVAGIPFFWSTLAGDLIYSFTLFGLFELLARRYPALQMTGRQIHHHPQYSALIDSEE